MRDNEAAISLQQRLAPPKRASVLAEATAPAPAKPPVRATRARRPARATACVPALKAARCLCRDVLPKRGFNNIFAKEIVSINVGTLNKFEDGASVDAAALIEAGILKKDCDGVKILSNGNFDKEAHREGHRFFCGRQGED